jgi:hypothetical protein
MLHVASPRCALYYYFVREEDKLEAEQVTAPQQVDIQSI